MHPQPNIDPELIVMFGALFLFCFVSALFTSKPVYFRWSLIFGIILFILIYRRR
jgi:hypothetical protein